MNIVKSNASFINGIELNQSKDSQAAMTVSTVTSNSILPSTSSGLKKQDIDLKELACKNILPHIGTSTATLAFAPITDEDESLVDLDQMSDTILCNLFGEDAVKRLQSHSSSEAVDSVVTDENLIIETPSTSLNITNESVDFARTADPIVFPQKKYTKNDLNDEGIRAFNEVVNTLINEDEYSVDTELHKKSFRIYPQKYYEVKLTASILAYKLAAISLKQKVLEIITSRHKEESFALNVIMLREKMDSFARAKVAHIDIRHIFEENKSKEIPQGKSNHDLVSQTKALCPAIKKDEKNLKQKELHYHSLLNLRGIQEKIIESYLDQYIKTASGERIFVSALSDNRYIKDSSLKQSNSTESIEEVEEIDSLNAMVNTSLNLHHKIQYLESRVKKLEQDCASYSKISRTDDPELFIFELPQITNEYSNEIFILDSAIRNEYEKEENKIKFILVKMLLLGVPADKLHINLSLICKKYNTKMIKLAGPGKIEMMKEYYFAGGLNLLRGFATGPNPNSFPASIMNLILGMIKNDISLTSGKIIREIKNKIKTGFNFEGVDISRLPHRSSINRLISGCGYNRVDGIWVFDTSLTQPQEINSGACNPTIVTHTTNSATPAETSINTEHPVHINVLSEIHSPHSSVIQSNETRKRQLSELSEELLSQHRSKIQKLELNIKQLNNTRRYYKCLSYKNEPKINFLKTSEASNIYEKEISHLNQAIVNKAENQVDRTKFILLKMLLEGTPASTLFVNKSAICDEHGSGYINLISPDRIEMMKEYYFVGGLELLRAFPIGNNSWPYPASLMNFILLMIKNDETCSLYTGRRIFKALKNKISMGEDFSGIDISKLPCREYIEKFIINSGYEMQVNGKWVFDTSLTQPNKI